MAEETRSKVTLVINEFIQNQSGVLATITIEIIEKTKPKKKSDA